MSHLAVLGELSYNGYVFAGQTHVTVKVDFVPDDADRTVLYQRHTLTARTVIHTESASGLTMQEVQSRLGAAGGHFRFSGHGIELEVNSPGGGLRDVRWGPKPRILSWEPIGSFLTAEVVWEVEVCVPKCMTNSIARTSGVMSVNFGVAISVDERGFSTRTISGHLEIAVTRIGRNVPDSADAYRHLIRPDIPLGFQRSSDWSVSPDKSRIDFTIVDTQVESKNPYPRFVTKIDARHRAAWSRFGTAKQQIRNTLSVNIETAAKNVSQTLAWNIFGDLARQRIDHARRAGFNAFLEEVTAEEDIFGHSNSFSVSWRILRTINEIQSYSGALIETDDSLRNLFRFEQAGMWKPVAGTNWAQWRASLTANSIDVFNNRGMAQLQVPAQNDVIVDLCGTGVTIPWVGHAPPTTLPMAPQQPTFKNEKPPAARSWLRYRSRLAILTQDPVARQAPLTSPAYQRPVNFQSTEGVDVGPSAASTADYDTMTAGGRPRHVVVLVGYAERAGYEVPKPTVLRLGGLTMTRLGEQFVCEQMGMRFGVPVFRAGWRIFYAIPTSPGVIHAPPSLEN